MTSGTTQTAGSTRSRGPSASSKVAGGAAGMSGIAPPNMVTLETSFNNLSHNMQEMIETQQELNTDLSHEASI